MEIYPLIITVGSAANGHSSRQKLPRKIVAAKQGAMEVVDLKDE